MGVASAQASYDADAPAPSEIEDACASDNGECYIYASEPDAEGNFTAFASQCTCVGGVEWSSEMLSSKGRSMDSTFTQQVCADALANCAPPKNPAPSEILVFPKEDIHTLSVECGREGESVDADIGCTLVRDETGINLRCECGDNGHGYFVPRPDHLTQQKAHSRCVEGVIICESMSDEENHGVDEIEDIEDIFDALGCELSTGSNGTGWPLSLGLLFLCGAFRRRRPKPRKA